MCFADHTNVADDYYDWDAIYPGAPALPNGEKVQGAGCVANLGSSAQATMSEVADVDFGTNGYYRSQGQTTRHSVNDFVVSYQTATEMTTHHYQIIELFILSTQTPGAPIVAYEGSGYTYQVKWAKQGAFWLITSMKYVHDGDGRLGLAPAKDVHDRYIAGLLGYSSGSGRQLEAAKHERPVRKLQSAAQYGNLNLLATRVPSYTTDGPTATTAYTVAAALGLENFDCSTSAGVCCARLSSHTLAHTCLNFP